MPKNVIDKDRGWSTLSKRMKSLGNGKAVAVGIQGTAAGQAHEGGLSNVELGTFHEFGGAGGRPPERPFMRGTFDKNKTKYEKEMALLAKQTFDPMSGKKPETSLLFIGELYRGDILQALKAGIPATDTGVPAHLRVTGQLWNSITAASVDLKDFQ